MPYTLYKNKERDNSLNVYEFPKVSFMKIQFELGSKSLIPEIKFYFLCNLCTSNQHSMQGHNIYTSMSFLLLVTVFNFVCVGIKLQRYSRRGSQQPE